MTITHIALIVVLILLALSARFTLKSIIDFNRRISGLKDRIDIYMNYNRSMADFIDITARGQIVELIERHITGDIVLFGYNHLARSIISQMKRCGKSINRVIENNDNLRKSVINSGEAGEIILMTTSEALQLLEPGDEILICMLHEGAYETARQLRGQLRDVSKDKVNVYLLEKTLQKKDDVLSHQSDFDKIYADYPLAQEILKGEYIDDPVAYSRENNSRLLHYYHMQFNKHIYNVLDLFRKASVLNIGCLFGLEEKRRNKIYPNLDLNSWGIDISAFGISIAMKNRPVANYAVSTAEKLPFPDEVFDRVISREVIEHVMEPLKMMREVYRVLKPGGIAVITTPNGDSLYHRIHNTGGNKKYKDDHMHLAELEELLLQGRFKIKKRVLDGVLYFNSTCTTASSSAEKTFRKVKALSFLRGIPFLNVLFCDQVKFVLKKEGRSPADNKPFYICPKCRKSLNLQYHCDNCKVDYYDRQINAPNFINTVGTKKLVR